MEYRFRRAAHWTAALPCIVLTSLVAGCTNGNHTPPPPLPGAAGPTATSSTTTVASPSTPASPTSAASSVKSNDDTTADLGLPVYPNAKPLSTISGSTAPVVVQGLVTTVMETNDPMDKVVAFYKQQFPEVTDSKNAHLHDGKHGDWTEGMEDGKPSAHLTVTNAKEGNGLRIVKIMQTGGKTHIEMMRISSTKSGDAIERTAESIEKTAESLRARGSSNAPGGTVPSAPSFGSAGAVSPLRKQENPMGSTPSLPDPVPSGRP